MGTGKKSFYIFLCMLLGILLFLLIQRSLFLIAYLAGATVTTSAGQALDYYTSTLAVFFGAWYGIWLGLVWHKAVYEDGTVKSTLAWWRRSRGNENTWEVDDLVVQKSDGTEPRKTLRRTQSVGETGVREIIPRPRSARKPAIRRTPVRKAVRVVEESADTEA